MISVSEFEPFDRNNVLFADDTWEALFHDTLKAHPEAARPLGLVFYDLLNAITDGDQSTQTVINTLKSGIEWLYRHSPVSNAAFVAFVYYLAGALPDADSLDRLLSESGPRPNGRKVKPAAKRARRKMRTLKRRGK